MVVIVAVLEANVLDLLRLSGVLVSIGILKQMNSFMLIIHFNWGPEPI